MSTVQLFAPVRPRALAAAFLAAASAFTAVPAVAAENAVGISDPGLLPQARAVLKGAPSSGEAETGKEGTLRDERPKAAWEECEPGSYYMIEGVDYSTPMLCRNR